MGDMQILEKWEDYYVTIISDSCNMFWLRFYNYDDYQNIPGFDSVWVKATYESGFSYEVPVEYIIDDYLIVGEKSLLFPALLYFMTIVLLGVFNFGKEGIITIFGQKIIRKIKEEMMNKLTKIPIEYLTTNESGSIVSRFSNDVEAVGSLFTNGIVSMIVDAFKIVGIVISICLFSYKLGVLVLLIIPVVYFLTRSFQKRMLKAQKKKKYHLKIKK
ncbi:ABC transporter transmembrane domain-containing protein [uncultured Campylobacter sp.]|uniref:ABC transporter transmembrane domain-containing protein n=1 Tax=uncultured Campylobacter sp. TaxID=218934 RepID=UPI0026221AAE|nr:ABC transporter transmembrane domain-containing protein [uncultured Campylobacter sp.]